MLISENTKYINIITSKGVVTIGVSNTHIMFYEDMELDPTHKYPIQTNPNEHLIFYSLAYKEAYHLVKEMLQSDICSLPIPQYFDFSGKELVRGIIRYNIGIGYLYPNNNSFIYMKEEISGTTKVNTTNLIFKGCKIVDYKRENAVYVVEDYNMRTFTVPFHIIEITNLITNPLFHFEPFIIYIYGRTEEFEWETIPGTNLQIYLEVKSIGNSYTVYVKNTNNFVVKTVVNYAVLNQMSKYQIEVKLVKGLTRLSTPGNYLNHLDKILKYVGVKSDED